MLLRVALVRTYISEESSASIIRVTRIGEIGMTLAVTRNRRRCEEILCHKVDGILHSHRCENLKSYNSCLAHVHLLLLQSSAVSGAL
jgi:hypothetical protein